MRLSYALAIVMVFVAMPAWAHKLAPSLLSLTEKSPTQYEVTWKTALKSASSTPLLPIFPADCLAEQAPVHRVEGAARVIKWLMVCQQGLAGQSLAVKGMADNATATVLRVQWQDGTRIQEILNASTPSFQLPTTQSAAQVIWGYLLLGVEHILLGIDHLLFVLALVLLLQKGRALFWTITAFTVGHSITLSLVSLGYLTYPVSLIEFAIALSILVLAIELSRGERTNFSHWIPSHGWLVAVAFGLLHGMGFAGALSEVGLPAGEVPLALLSFNIGIELGQIAFVVTCLAAMHLSRHWAPQRLAALRWGSIYSIGGLSAFWCIERGLSSLV